MPDPAVLFVRTALLTPPSVVVPMLAVLENLFNKGVTWGGMFLCPPGRGLVRLGRAAFEAFEAFCLTGLQGRNRFRHLSPTGCRVRSMVLHASDHFSVHHL